MTEAETHLLHLLSLHFFFLPHPDIEKEDKKKKKNTPNPMPSAFLLPRVPLTLKEAQSIYIPRL